jgi:hypothetical protein
MILMRETPAGATPSVQVVNPSYLGPWTLDRYKQASSRY